MMEAIQLYRHQFQPSEQLDRPYAMLGFNCIAAETDEEAQLLATSIQQAFVALRTGSPVPLPPPSAGYTEELPPHARALLRQVLSCSAVGSPGSVKTALEEFMHRTNADELMVTSQIYDHKARLRSYELLIGAVQ
jgi:alkanesulfonate monooxygenase SsuD/methylene tetrahydromethanopterin reductase-like flavin-dependent oxidoreductase (luciferase family)